MAKLKSVFEKKKKHEYHLTKLNDISILCLQKHSYHNVFFYTGAGPPRYEHFKKINFAVSDTDQYVDESGLVEFRAVSTNRPFLLLIFEKDSSGNFKQAYLPYGLVFPEPVSTAFPFS